MNPCLLALSLLAGQTAADQPDVSLLEGGAWVEDPLGVPVIDRGPAGSWDNVAVDNPFVYREDGVFYCYFEAENERGQEQVGLATSPDLRHWTKHKGNPVLSAGPDGSWDAMAAKLPVVGKHDNTYHMLYTGKDRRGHAAIGLATSGDARQWEKRGDGPILPGRAGSWDPILTTCPSLIRKDGTYYAVYRGMTDFYQDQKLGLMTSENLRDWRRPETPLEGLDGIYSFAVCSTPLGSGHVALSQMARADRFYLSENLTDWRPGPRPRFHPSAIETPSNPIIHDGQLWILYEKSDRIYRARLSRPADVGTHRLPFNEGFSDPDGSARGWWPVEGDWSFADGVCRQTVADGQWARLLAGTESLADCEVGATVRLTTGSGWTGLCAAHARGFYCFAIVYDGRNTARLFRTASGVFGETDWLVDVPFTPRQGDSHRLNLRLTGKTIACTIDGRTVIEMRDEDLLPAGQVGLFTAGAAAEFDDVAVDGAPVQ